jgi:3-isopropylmalate/(R)-2-methylmalate dehydratase small subunit
MITGKAIKFGDNIDTDQIIGAHHLTLPAIRDMAPFTFEHHAHFISHFTRGDILVGEENFGCGSSREQAPAVLKARGVAAIVARSFARIFFRNAINLGLRLIVCAEAAEIRELDELAIDHDHLRNLTTGKESAIEPLPPFIREILDGGGVLPYLRKKTGVETPLPEEGQDIR